MGNTWKFGQNLEIWEKKWTLGEKIENFEKIRKF